MLSKPNNIYQFGYEVEFSQILMFCKPKFKKNVILWKQLNNTMKIKINTVVIYIVSHIKISN